IDTQQGSGTFVAATPPTPSSVAKIAASAALEAHETGVDPREVAAAIYVVPRAPAEPLGEESRRRMRLREQIAALELALVEMEAKYPGIAPRFSEASGGIGPVLLETGELERIRTEMVRRITVVQAAIDRLGADEPGVEEKPKPAPKRKRAARRQGRVRPAP